jgi:LacI family transcriptional regulator/LacI family repressor for deo operon, udp, cdd, tsx, nupC, and nupG
MSISIKDIAQLAGVSPSTVSRALHDHPRISQETKTRIRQLARELGYTPSLPARSLVTRHTATIGMVITTASDPFLAGLVQGVEETAERNGYSVFLSSSYRNAERELEVVRSLQERRASGIIITGSQIDDDYLEMSDLFPLPIVLINCRTYPYSVYSDKLSGARQAIEYLVQLGHRRIAFIGGPPSRRSRFERFNGYRQVLEEKGVPLDDSLVLEGEGTLASGVKAAEQMLAMSRPPTASFCFNDLTAIGLIRGLQQAEANVPRDYSVVGFDDLEMASYYCPPLTTVHQPTHHLGQRAINMLLELIQGEPNIRSERLPAELVIRESTGPASEQAL